MFERLQGLGDDVAAVSASAGFVDGQNTKLRAQDDEMFDETAAGIRGENLALLETLGEIGDQLNVPDIIAELSAGIVAQPRFRDATAQLDTFVWMPHAPAMVGKDLLVSEGVRAIRGWHVEWAGDSITLPGATMLLYQRRPGDAESFEAPHLAVIPSELSELQPADTRGRIDILLRAESAMAYRLTTLLAYSKEHHYQDLTNQQRGWFIAEARALFWAIFGSDDSRTEYGYTKNVRQALQDKDALAWTQQKGSDTHSPLILAGAYQEAVYRIGYIDKEEDVAKKGFISPKVLLQAEQIFESRNLVPINKAFAPPVAQRGRFGIKKVVDGGMIAIQSWPVNTVGQAALVLERQRIAERLEAMYLQLLAA